MLCSGFLRIVNMRTRDMGASVNGRFTLPAFALTGDRTEAAVGAPGQRRRRSAEQEKNPAILRRADCEQSGKIAMSAIRSPFVPGTVCALTSCAETEPEERRG
jgi:hypothetical protein